MHDLCYFAYKGVLILLYVYLFHRYLPPRFAKTVLAGPLAITISDVLLAVSYLLYGLLYHYNPQIYVFASPIWNNILYAAMLQIIVLLFGTGSLGLRIYVSFTYSAFYQIGCLLGGYANAQIGTAIQNGTWSGMPPWVAEYAYLMEYVIILPVMLLGIFLFCKRYPADKQGLNRLETLFLSIPNVACMAVAVLVQLNTVYLSTNNRNLYGLVPGASLLTPAVGIILFTVVFVTLELFRFEVMYYKDQSAKTIMRGRINDMQGHVEDMEQLYSGIRSLKHDMKNHMAHMAYLIRETGMESQEITAYFSSIDITLQKLDYRHSTGHAVTDVIVNSCSQKLEQNHVRFESLFQFPAACAIDVFDISTVLSNALDNAAQAAILFERKYQGKGYVKLHSVIKGNAYFLVNVENPYTGDLRFDAKTGLPLSTKVGADHGIGLLNIHNCARKYMGDIDIQVSKGRFVLTVMMRGANR